jgi:hypothetical protein
MFGARKGTMIGTNFDASLITIFKNFASNDSNICIRIDGKTAICQFVQQIHDQNGIMERRRQGNVFSFCSAKRYKGLHTWWCKVYSARARAAAGELPDAVIAPIAPVISPKPQWKVVYLGWGKPHPRVLTINPP